MSTTLNIASIREEFPILDQQIHGKPLVYFDNAATSQRPLRVIEKINEFSLNTNANIHRATHTLANRTTEAFEKSRTIVANFINAKEVGEIIFTSGTTESINLVAHSFGDALVVPGDEIIVTEMEHHANIVPWQMMCERRCASLKVIPFDEDGTLVVSQLDSLITSKTKLVAVAHVSNTLGTINPVEQIIALAHAKGVPVLIDGAQAAPHIKIDVQALDCDFYAFSAHKTYGPTGTGVLYGKRSWLERIPPFLGGGEMINRVTFAKTTYNELPYKFEAGTPNYVGAIAMGEALEFIAETGLREMAQHEHQLLNYATGSLEKIDGLRIYGRAKEKTGVICFNIEGIHPFDMGTLLDQLGIAVRTGRLCADPVMDHFKVENMVRASFAVYNTEEEIDLFINALRRIKGMF